MWLTERLTDFKTKYLYIRDIDQSAIMTNKTKNETTKNIFFFLIFGGLLLQHMSKGFYYLQVWLWLCNGIPNYYFITDGRIDNTQQQKSK